MAVALGAVLLVAGLLKLIRPMEFYGAVLAYDLPVPDAGLRVIAVALPWLEVLCGSCLVLGRWVSPALFVAAVLGLGFCGALAQAALRGLELQCGCFGTIMPSWFDQLPMALVRAALLAVVAVWLWLTRDAP